MNPGLCLILTIFVDYFYSRRPKSSYGCVLAVDFDDFYRQHSFGFHIFRAIILQNSCTLTSSISFGECLNAGTIYPKFEPKWKKFQAGRPITCGISSWNFTRMVLSTSSKSSEGCFTQETEVKTEMLEPRQVGSSYSDKSKNQDQHWLEKQCTTIHQCVGATECWEVLEPGWPD